VTLNRGSSATWRRWALVCGVVFFVALVSSFRPGAFAQQFRTVTQGVYTAAQAKRGEALYMMRCVACHGPALAGDLGPPLSGDVFVNNWQSLADLTDKISNTMPYDEPRTLTKAQVADVIAFVLQTNRFPAGSAELGSDDATLRQVSLGRGGGAPAPGLSTVAFPPVGTLNQVMRGILFPSSNVLFDVQTRDPSAQPKPGTRADATTTSARYGDVYDSWTLVDTAAIALAEAAPLLMTSGRRCENGKPVPVDRADWQRYVQGLVEVGRAAYRASQTRNQDAVAKIADQLSDTCANCHRVYRDVASAAMRCTPP
jgi:mono/diheme cytochrome c family protein